MSIVDSKEGTLGPGLVLPMLWLDDVQNNRYSVFIVVANKALIRVCSVGTNNSISLETAFGWLVVRNDDAGAGLQGQLLALKSIFMHHRVSVHDGQRLDLCLGTGLGVHFL